MQVYRFLTRERAARMSEEQEKPVAEAPIYAKRLLVLFAIMMMIFGYLAFRSEVNANAIRDNERETRAAAREVCEVTNKNAQALNALIDTIIQAVLDSSTIPEGEKAQRIALYESAKAKQPSCLV